jgi:hypothetical protein
MFIVSMLYVYVQMFRYMAIWRNGKEVLPMTKGITTAYNDSIAPYLKFGVYRGSWKGASAPTVAKTTSIAYAAIKVGDATSGFDEVSTAVAGNGQYV